MPAPIETLAVLQRDIAAIVAAGGRTTPEYDRLAQRWELTGITHDFGQAALEAVLGDTPAEQVALALGLAYQAQPNPVAEAGVRNSIARRVEALMREQYALVAADNYETLRQRWNQAAAKLLTATRTTDPTAPAANMLTQPAKERTAWLELPVLAHQLEAELPMLRTAAQLADPNAPSELLDYSLSVDPDAPPALRRTIWSTWDEGATDHAGGRLTALAVIPQVSLGARSLGELAPYRRPRPLEVRYLPSTGGFSGHVSVDYDPETDQPKGATPAGSSF